MVARTQHYIHNPQEFLKAKAYERQEKAYKTACLTQLIGAGVNSIFNLTTCFAGNVGGENTTTADATESKKEVKAEPKDEPKAETDKEKEEFIKDALTKGGIDYDKESANFQKDVLIKYNKMMETYGNNPPSKEIIQKRLANYASGYKLNEAKNNALIQKDGVLVDFSNSEGEELDNRCAKLANFDVAFYDRNNDDKIDISEIFYRKLVDLFVKRGTDVEKAHKQADAFIKKHEQDIINFQATGDISNFGENETFLLKLLHEADSEISFMNGLSEDITINAEETANGYKAMLKLCDDNNDITNKEYSFAKDATKFCGMTVEEIAEEAECSVEQAQVIYNYVEKYTFNFLEQ